MSEIQLMMQTLEFFGLPADNTMVTVKMLTGQKTKMPTKRRKQPS